jgi:hypothetical protein
MRQWLARRYGHWKKLREQDQSEDSSGTILLIDKWVLSLYRLGFWLAPSWLFIDAAEPFATKEHLPPEERASVGRREERLLAFYIVGWLVALIALWLAAPTLTPLAIGCAVIAIVRLVEIVVAVLGFVLDRHHLRFASSLITIALLAVQIALIFAILAQSLAPHDFLKPYVLSAAEGGPGVATTPAEFLYLTWTYMTTLGNPYIAASGIARALQVGANTAGILLLGIVAAHAVGLIGDTNSTDLRIETGTAGSTGSSETAATGDDHFAGADSLRE